jgi:hypothetical protein
MGKISLTVVLVTAFWFALLVQKHLVLTVQQVVFSESTIPVVSLLHGVRVIAAWLFGWWSVLLLAPNVLLLALAGEFGIVSRIDWASLSFLTLSVVYLVSAPFAISMLKWSGLEANRSNFEWRRLMVVGLISGAINVLGQTALWPPDTE